MALQIEEWRTIAEYEGHYEVSNLGRARSLDRVDCGGRSRKGKVLIPNNGTYIGVCLNKDRRQSFHRIARLVADAFMGECPSGYEVHHKDGDTHNNRLDNLQYVTHEANMRYAFLAGNRGRLRADDIQDIFAHERAGLTPTQIAKLYSTDRSLIYRILGGDAYRMYQSMPNHP